MKPGHITKAEAKLKVEQARWWAAETAAMHKHAVNELKKAQKVLRQMS